MAEMSNDVREIELKFELPADKQRALEQALKRRGAVLQRLQAHYYDTPDGRLEARRAALRLRLEDGRWVQTLKAIDDGGQYARLEHNVDRGTARRAPMLDPRRHAGSDAGRAVAEVLAEPDQTFVELYRSEVERLLCEIDAPGGARIELALDRGALHAGAARAPLHELEFELKAGAPHALVQAARPWIVRYGLWLQHASKAERGQRLARDGAAATPPVVKASPPALRPGLSAQALLQAVLRNALDHVLPNASAVAAGNAEAEHVHQLRVGLRRLRTALREFDGAHAAGLSGHEAALAPVFRTLGQLRDADSVLGAVAQRLLQAGAPGVGWATAAPSNPPDVVAAVRAAPFQCALTDLLGYTLAPADPASQPAPARPAAERLKALHRRLERDGRGFDKLRVDEQHRVRKRVKRLRYLAGFVAPLYPAPAVQAYLDALEPAQEALGELSDLRTAAGIAAGPAAQGDADAAFALDWLQHESRRAERSSRQALRALADAPRFWRKGALRPAGDDASRT